MGRLAQHVQATTVTSGRQYTCKVDTICQDDEDRAAVRDLLADKSLSVRSKAQALGVHPEVLTKHLRKACQCYKRGA